MPNQEIRNVLMVVDATQELTRAAQMALDLTAPEPAPATPRGLPKNFHHDSSFPPIPISVQGMRELTMSAIEGSAQGGLVVRGQVRAGELASVIDQSHGRLFADPFVEAMPTTCGGNPAVGAAVDVARLLDTTRLSAAGMHGNGVAIAIVDNGVSLAAPAGSAAKPQPQL